MVCSYHETECGDGAHSVDHSHNPKSIHFSGMVNNDLGNHAEAGEDEDVYFGVSEESKKMLI